MSIELAGFVAFFFGLIGIHRGTAFCIASFQVSLLFGAAAGIILTSFGGANLMPSHLFLLFLVFNLLKRPDEFRRAMQSFSAGSAGFWLLMTIITGVLTAIFMPRIFADATSVITVSRQGNSPNLLRVPLAPVSGNITQSVYIVGDLVCFVALSSYLAGVNGLRAMAVMTLICGALNLAFAGLDYGTYLTGTSDMLSFMRNATYRMLDDTEVGGFKRLVGSYPEASTFAYATLGFFAFSARLWCAGVRPVASALVALGSLICLVLSTSSTAYLGLTLLICVFYAEVVLQTLRQRASRMTILSLWLIPLLLCGLVLGLQFNEGLWFTVTDMVNHTIFQKTTSSSGLERASWNTQAIQNIFDTYGLGAGVGSLRASSFLIAVPASIGVIGTLTYSMFLLRVFFAREAPFECSDIVAIRRAARAACFAQLLAGIASGTFIDLGLFFFVYAAIATSRASAPFLDTLPSIEIEAYPTLSPQRLVTNL